MLDMFNIMGKVKEAQERIKKIKENLAQVVVTGESGGGMVKATVDGNRKILKIEIEPSIVRPEDREMIQDLVVAAVNIALQSVDEKIKDELRKGTEGLLPNIPGLDLGNLA
ncbi:MAG: YbaB/EbfC family nucleoid-associated protein [Cytophagaceae bacterium]|nr:YbaB/EbfC family nucleoid-associated protein [Cytophagaceae bacterium]MDW8457225.1 YbaB/EbfC family nucleoid-associated protein [Cytophagaceae bacterium]